MSHSLWMRNRLEQLTEADALDVLAGVTPGSLSSSVDGGCTELVYLVFGQVDDTVGGVLDHAVGSLAPGQVTHDTLLHHIALDVRSTVVSRLAPLDGDGVFGGLQAARSTRWTRRICESKKKKDA